MEATKKVEKEEENEIQRKNSMEERIQIAEGKKQMLEQEEIEIMKKYY